jgi:hypothetical protein
MYRRAAAQGPLQGVAAGPYTGGPRTIDAGKLSPATRKRLAECLASRAEPSPIASDRASAISWSVAATWAAIVAIIAGVLVFARGFDDPASAWEIQPFYAVVLYLLVFGLFVWARLAIMRRRFLIGGETLRPGRYLLPLDFVEIAAVDARGRQRITVRPLGDARDAVVRGEGRSSELVITFVDTSVATFALRADPGGQVTLRRLEHAQRLLEELTYSKDLAQSFDHDPFFDFRADGSWATASATAEDAPLSLRTKRSLVMGRAGWAMAIAAAIVLALGAFGARNAIGRRLRTVRDARAERERAAKELAERRAREDEEEEKAREEASKKLYAQKMTPMACAEAFRDKANPAHPEVPKILAAMIDAAERAHDPRVQVFWRRLGPAGPIADVDWALREDEMLRTFGRVVSEACPSGVLRFTGQIGDDDEIRELPKWGLFIDYTRSWPKKYVVARRGVPGETLTVEGPSVVFDVKLVGPNASGTATFRLTMPPPDKLAMAHRPASIFASSLVDDGTYDERVYGSLTARAFDRLYDELWSLFFAGNPRVPLDRLPTSTHTTGDP